MAKPLTIQVTKFHSSDRFQYSVGGFVAFGFATREAAQAAAEAFRPTLTGEGA